MNQVQPLHMGSRLIGPNHAPIMIAEEGQANQGSHDLALQMCDKARAAEADGIEFQFFLADDMYTRTDSGYKVYKERELTFDQIKLIIEYAKSLGLLVQIAGLSPKVIEFCASVGVDSFCINATDLNNPQILDVVADTGSVFWVATLMATLAEIDECVNYLIRKNSDNFGLLHGQHVMSTSSSKGVPANLLQLDSIQMLQNRYDKVVGFVDHSVSSISPALAVAKGACLVTKHLAPWEGWIGPDSDICMTPDDWREIKNLFLFAYAAGGASKELSLHELSDRQAHRRSLYSRHALKTGHLLCDDDIVALRPFHPDSPASLLPSLIGKKLLHSLPEQALITPSALSSDSVDA
jgi:sialic acid synthase SpsE